MDLSLLNERQREAVLYTEGALLIMAGAGSGKTRVLTKRIEYLISEKNVRPYQILALTFTNKAANEMKERLRKNIGDAAMEIYAGTFHSICAKILRRYADRLGYNSNFVIYDSSDQLSLIKNIMKENSISDKEINPKNVKAKISNAKNSLTTVSEYEEDAFSAEDFAVATIYRLYEHRLREYNAMDFDDLIVNVIELFKTDKEVLKKYSEQFRYVNVDEYQDTNSVQYVLVSLFSSFHKNICVVGDQDQSIYSWRGADIRNITDFEKDFEGAKTILLEQNYRSTKNILGLANAVIKNNDARVEKKLWTEYEDGRKISYYCADNEKFEAAFVAKTINIALDRGYSYGDIAILYRTNAQSFEFETALNRENIPHKIVGGLKFYDRKEIKDLNAYLRAVANSDDVMAYQRIINKPLRGIGQKSFEKLVKLKYDENISLFDAIKLANKNSLLSGKARLGLSSFVKIIENAKNLLETYSVSKLLSHIIETTGYRDELILEDSHEARVRIENIDELLSQIMNRETLEDDFNLNKYLEDLSLSSDQDELGEDESESVLMMTLHTAKGLEFKIVFLVGFEENIFPSAYIKDDPNLIEEERRLCYVGITRAMKELYITHSETRFRFGKNKANNVSRFFDEMPDEYINFITNRRYFGTKIKIKSEAENYKSSVNFDDFDKGTKVKHQLFGNGLIINTKEVDNDLELLIAFDDKGLKRIRASLANLKIIV